MDYIACIVKEPCQKAVVSYNKGNYEQSLRFIKQCKSQFRKNRDERGLQYITLLMLEGDIHYKMRKYSQGRKVFLNILQLLKRSAENFQDAQLSLLYGRSYRALAFIEADRNDEEKFKTYLEKANYHFIKSKNPEDIVITGEVLATYYSNIKNVPNAEKVISDVIKWAKKLKDPLLKHSTLGKMYLNRSQLESDNKKIQKLLSKAEKHFQKSDDMDGIGRVKLAYITLKMNSGEFPKNDIVSLQSFAESHGLGEIKEKVSMLIAKQTAVEGNLDDAISKTIETLSIRATSENPSHAVSANLELGRLHIELKKFEEAMMYANSALAIAEKSQNKSYVGLSKELLASVYSIQGKHRKAIKVFKEAEKYLKDADNHEALLRTYLHLTDILIMQQDYENAEHFLNKGLAISELAKNPVGEAFLRLRKLAFMIDSRQDIDDINAELDQARALISSIDDHFGLSDKLAEIEEVLQQLSPQ